MRKTLAILALFLALPLLAFGQGVFVGPFTSFKVVNGITMPNSNATITVCATGASGIPCSPALTNTVYSNIGLTVPLSNPFTSDANGNYSFTVAPGNYTITETASSGFAGKSFQVSPGGGTSSGTVTGATPNGGLFLSGANLGLLTSCIAPQVEIFNGTAWICGSQIPITTVTGLASVLGKTNGTLAAVTNAASAADCTVGGGSSTALCQFNGSTWSSISATSVPFSGLTSSTNTAAAMVVGTGAGTSTSGSGQVAATQTWAPNFNFQKPTVTTSGTGAGGSFSNGHSALVQITFNTAAGETLAGPLAAGVGCGGGGGCTATVTAPTIPAGYTGYTVYDCDTSNSSTCSGVNVILRQTALAPCVNITTSCVISTPGAGAAPPTTTTAFVQPPNVQASDCPPSVLPTGFIQTNDGNYHTQSGVYTNTTNGLTGVMVDCRQHFFTDEGAAGSATHATSEPIAYNNSFMVINHIFGQYTSAANQDRALSILAANPTNDSATRYAMEGLQIENDFNCNGCTINGSPDGEVTNTSLQFQDNAATNFAAPTTYGNNVIRAQYFKAGPGSMTGGSQYSILNALFLINDNTFSGAPIFSGLTYQAAGANSTSVNLASTAVYNKFNTVKTFSNGQFALYSTGVPLGTNNFLIRSDGPGISSFLNGPTTLSSITNNNAAAMPITAAVAVTPSVTVSQASVLSGPSGVSCAGGASTYNYKFVGVDANGGQFVSTTNGTCSTGTNPLTSGNPATINNNLPLSTVAQFVSVDVYRTAGPMALGKIGSLTCAATSPGANPCATGFSDTGLAAGAALPTANTTGTVQAQGFSTLTNCSVNSASPAACGSATSGAVVIPTTTTTYTVNTTQITTHSRVLLTWLTFASDLPSAPTCVAPVNTTVPTISNVVAGTSFTIALGSTTGQTCPQFEVVN